MITAIKTVFSNTIFLIAVFAVVIALADGFGWRLQAPDLIEPISTLNVIPAA